MTANITAPNEVAIVIDVKTAEALGALLGRVSDCTSGEGLTYLYEALSMLPLQIEDEDRVIVEENPFAQDEDEPAFNIVVE